jgi:GTP cyclohydrolase II
MNPEESALTGGKAACSSRSPHDPDEQGLLVPPLHPQARELFVQPSVTVTYAQSLDGSLSDATRRATSLSGPESWAFTHRLRASHAAILVGIGTVLADDPQLTVRHAEGPNPQPIVLDSHLRCPLDRRLFRHPTHRLWLATTSAAPADRRAALEAAGARVLCLPPCERGRIDLPALLRDLGERGVGSLMVEGGAQVITAFLAQRLAHRLVVTVTPHLVGGLRAIHERVDVPFGDVRYHLSGRDVIVDAQVTAG